MLHASDLGKTDLFFYHESSQMLELQELTGRQILDIIKGIKLSGIQKYLMLRPSEWVRQTKALFPCTHFEVKDAPRIQLPIKISSAS